MSGLANLYLQIIIIITSVCAVDPAIDVVRRHYGVDHLHEPGGSVDCSSNSSRLCGCVRYNFITISDVRIVLNIRLFPRIACRFYPLNAKVHVNTFANRRRSVSAGSGGGSQMWRYIRFKFVRRFYSYSFLLWSSDQICTMFSRFRLYHCRLNTRPVGPLSVRATGC